MSIENVHYNEDGSIIATIDGVEMTIPDNIENIDRRKIAQWVSQGNSIKPYVPMVINIPIITYKGDVWRRVSNEQASQLDTEIQKLDVRERNLWSDSLHLDHSDPFFKMLREDMIKQWGVAETDRILAPSEG